MRLLGIDFETTGLEIGKVSVVEVGMALWDTNIRVAVKVAGYLVDPGPGAFWEPGACDTNGLSPEICTEYGVLETTGLKQVLSWMNVADVMVAHNGNKFDKPILIDWAKKHNMPFDHEKPWIDTKTDLNTPQHNSTRLFYMGADHGFLNPFPHRALFDVMSMMKVLDCYDIHKVLEYSNTPTILVKAIVSFHNNQLARARGYHAEYENGKFVMWNMPIKENMLEQEREGCRIAGFDIEVVKVLK